MADTRDPYYEIDQFGSLLFHLTGETRNMGDQDLGVCFDSDPEVPTLYKHGRADLVTEHATKLAAIDPTIQTIIIPRAVLSGPHGGPILDEINQCLAISGRVGQLAERLTALGVK